MTRDYYEKLIFTLTLQYGLCQSIYGYLLIKPDIKRLPLQYLQLPKNLTMQDIENCRNEINRDCKKNFRIKNGIIAIKRNMKKQLEPFLRTQIANLLQMAKMPLRSREEIEKEIENYAKTDPFDIDPCVWEEIEKAEENSDNGIEQIADALVRILLSLRMQAPPVSAHESLHNFLHEVRRDCCFWARLIYDGCCGNIKSGDDICALYPIENETKNAFRFINNNMFFPTLIEVRDTKFIVSSVFSGEIADAVLPYIIACMDYHYASNVIPCMLIYACCKGFAKSATAPT